MNADMLSRGAEDRPPPPLSLSLFFFIREGERPLRPPLDPPLKGIAKLSKVGLYLGEIDLSFFFNQHYFGY